MSVWFRVSGGMQATIRGLHLYASNYGSWVLVGPDLIEIERGLVPGVERTPYGLVEAQGECEAAAVRYLRARPSVQQGAR